jgi:DNA-binding phage protein
VGRGAAGEVVALHDALKPFAAARADDVDAFAVLEHGDQNLIAHLRIAVLRQRHLAQHARGRNVGLLVVARERLARLCGRTVDQTDLTDS